MRIESGSLVHPVPDDRARGKKSSDENQPEAASSGQSSKTWIDRNPRVVYCPSGTQLVVNVLFALYFGFTANFPPTAVFASGGLLSLLSLVSVYKNGDAARVAREVASDARVVGNKITDIQEINRRITGESMELRGANETLSATEGRLSQDLASLREENKRREDASKEMETKLTELHTVLDQLIDADGQLKQEEASLHSAVDNVTESAPLIHNASRTLQTLVDTLTTKFKDCSTALRKQAEEVESKNRVLQQSLDKEILERQTLIGQLQKENAQFKAMAEQSKTQIDQAAQLDTKVDQTERLAEDAVKKASEIVTIDQEILRKNEEVLAQTQEERRLLTEERAENAKLLESLTSLQAEMEKIADQ